MTTSSVALVTERHRLSPRDQKESPFVAYDTGLPHSTCSKVEPVDHLADDIENVSPVTLFAFALYLDWPALRCTPSWRKFSNCSNAERRRSRDPYTNPSCSVLATELMYLCRVGISARALTTCCHLRDFCLSTMAEPGKDAGKLRWLRWQLPRCPACALPTGKWSSNVQMKCVKYARS